MCQRQTAVSTRHGCAVLLALPVVSHEMPATIGDVRRYGMDPVEGIEQANGGAGAGIWRCRDLEQSAMAADAIGRKRGAGDVASEPLELVGILQGDSLSGKKRRTRDAPKREDSP